MNSNDLSNNVSIDANRVIQKLQAKLSDAILTISLLEARIDEMELATAAASVSEPESKLTIANKSTKEQ